MPYTISTGRDILPIINQTKPVVNSIMPQLQIFFDDFYEVRDPRYRVAKSYGVAENARKSNAAWSTLLGAEFLDGK